MSTSEQNAKITLYWLEKSRSQRILWLLEELNVKYDLKTFKRQEGLAPPELKQIHPLGKSPIVTIETESMSTPLVLAESGFMTEYLAEHFGPWLIPKKYAEEKEGQIGGESEEWLRYRYFMHYAEGSMMVLLVIKLVFNTIKNGSPFFLKPIVNGITSTVESRFLNPNFKTHFDFLENQIETSPNGGEYLCGKEISAADILMSFPLVAAKGRAGFSKEAHPNLWAYCEKLEQRDARKRAIQKIVEVEGSYEGTL